MTTTESLDSRETARGQGFCYYRHRELVKREWTSKPEPQRVGRLFVEPHIAQLVLQFARENSWGDDRISGELKKLGYLMSHETVRQILRRHGISPVP